MKLIIIRIASAVVVVLVADVSVAQTASPLVRTVIVAVQANVQPESDPARGTGSFTTGIGGTSVALAAGFQMPLDGRIGLGVEFSLGRPFQDSQSSTSASSVSTLSYEHRDHLLTVVTRLGIGGRGRLAYTGSFGPAIVFEHETRTSTFAPAGFPASTFTITDKQTRLGLTGGVDVFITLTSRLAMAVPVRVTCVARGDANARFSGLNTVIFRGGVGLAFTL